MTDAEEIADGHRAEQALSVIRPALEGLRVSYYNQLLGTPPDNQAAINRLIAKAQVVEDLIGLLERTVGAGEAARLRQEQDAAG